MILRVITSPWTDPDPTPLNQPVCPLRKKNLSDPRETSSKNQTLPSSFHLDVDATGLMLVVRS